jgi:hypothetical protein
VSESNKEKEGSISVTKSILHNNGIKTNKVPGSSSYILRSFSKYPSKNQRPLFAALTLAVVLMASTPLASIIIARLTLTNTLDLLDYAISMAMLSSSVNMYIGYIYAGVLYINNSPLVTSQIYAGNMAYLQVTKGIFERRTFLTSPDLIRMVPDIVKKHICTDLEQYNTPIFVLKQ